MDWLVEYMDLCVMQSSFRSGQFEQDSSYETQRPRGSPDWLLIVTVSGAGEHVWSGDSRHRGHDVSVLPPSSVLLYPPGVPQWYRTHSSLGYWRLLWTHFPETGRFDGLLELPALERAADPAPRFLTLPHGTQEVAAAMYELLGWHATASTNRERFAWNALERVLLWCDAANPRSTTGSLDPRVATVMQTVAANPADRRSIAEMAEKVGLSRTRLSHLFKNETGESYPEYVERRRMELAQDQLRMTGSTVAEIARRVGYDDPLYFSRRFKGVCGVSPRAWREAAAAGEL